jgi:hypothetical protein
VQQRDVSASAGIAAIVDIVLIAGPFLAPGEGSLASKADLGRKVLLFNTVHGSRGGFHDGFKIASAVLRPEMTAPSMEALQR